MKNLKDTIYKIQYVLDQHSKWRLPLVFLILIGGAAAELIGVSIILPIINLAVDPQEVLRNRYCRIITFVTGVDTAEGVMILLIIATILIYIVKNVYLVCMNNTIYRFTMNVQRKMAVRLMRAYVSQPYSFFLQRNSSENLRSISTDTANFQQVVMNVLQILSNALLSLVMIIYLIKTNWWITVVVLVVLGSSFLFIYFRVNQPMRKMGKENQILGGRILQTLQETFHGIKEIKILKREEYFISQYEQQYAKQTELGRKANLLSILPRYMIEALAITAVMLCLIIAITTNGNYTYLVGQLAVFAVAAFKLLPAANAIYAYFSTVMYHRASIDLVFHDIYEADQLEKRMASTRETDAEHAEDAPFRFENDITLNNLWFRYEGTENDVLKGVSFSIYKGEAVGLMGKSGGGKTTTVDLILGLLEPEKGTVVVDGRNICSDRPGWLDHIGYIPQSIYLADSSIKNNIAFGLLDEEIDEQEVLRAAREAQLSEFVDSLPDGLNTMIGEAGVRLSGGQRQRIGIARALYNNPEVLVLDEATSALDKETETAVMDAIDHLHGSKTLIIIAHRLTTLSNCDKVYEIVDGKAVLRDLKQLF